MVRYLRLAEVGYFGQIIYAVVGSVLLFVDFALVYPSSALSVVAAPLGFVVAYAWWHLGKSSGISFFVYAGILGMVTSSLSAALALWTWLVPFSSGFPPSLEGLTVVIGLVGWVYLYFQLRSFFHAARVLQDKLFRYAGFAFIGGFIGIIAVTVVGSLYEVSYELPVIFSGGQMPVCTLSSSWDFCSLFFRVVIVQTGAGYLWSGLVALMAGIAFKTAGSKARPIQA